MPEQVRCPSCNAALRVPDNLLGKNVKCPKCQTTFLAEMEEPAEPEGIVREPAPRRSKAMEETEEEEFLEEEEEERPRRRRKRRFAEAKSAVAGPAIAMMVSAGLGIFGNIAYLVLRLIVLGMEDKVAVQANPGFRAGYAFGLGLAIAGSLLGILFCIVALVGAAKMKKLQNHGLAMTACILSMLPCNTCCLLGLPFGIWGLVILNKPEVKDAFR